MTRPAQMAHERWIREGCPVIVCVCNGLRDSICRETATDRRCRGPGCIYRLNGARVQCGRCVPMMRELYLQHAPVPTGRSRQMASGRLAITL